jgi:GNAT superfamily N-acetyltransferase
MTPALASIPPGRRNAFALLFTPHRELTAVIGGVLHGGLGAMVTDDSERPSVARLSIGCYEIFGGDPDSIAARQIVGAAAAPSELVYGGDPAWRRLLLNVHGTALSDRPMRSFSSFGLASGELRVFSARRLEGAEVVRLDAVLASGLDPELAPHGLQVFSSPEAFIAQGVGFGAVLKGRLVCAATSYATYPGHLEVAIATRPAFRGRGLGTVVAARLLLHCLETGVRPHWNASNPVSQRLAVRLGFRPAGLCDVLYLRG